MNLTLDTRYLLLIIQYAILFIFLFIFLFVYAWLKRSQGNTHDSIAISITFFDASVHNECIKQHSNLKALIKVCNQTVENFLVRKSRHREMIRLRLNCKWLKCSDLIEPNGSAVCLCEVEKIPTI